MNRTKKKEFSIEGVCYSGKTTLAKSLSENWKNSLFVPEYSFFDLSVKRRNNFPPISKQDSMQAFQFFLNLDQTRKGAVNAQKQSLIFSDRSIISTIAFEYAKSKANIPNVFDQVDQLIDEHLLNIELPLGWIYIRFNDLELIKKRINSHHIGLKFLIEENTLANLQFFYDFIFEKIKQFSLVVSASEAPKLQLEQTSAFIKTRIKSIDKLSHKDFSLIIKEIIKKI